jgi:hypothetical protein
MWSNFYENGGWGMYPTTLFGFLLVAAGVLLLLRPERRYVPLVSGLGLMTLASGVLGCAVGFINTFRYVGGIPREEQLEIAAVGMAESLNNVVLVTIGALRNLRSRPAG